MVRSQTVKSKKRERKPTDKKVQETEKTKVPAQGRGRLNNRIRLESYTLLKTVTKNVGAPAGLPGMERQTGKSQRKQKKKGGRATIPCYARNKVAAKKKPQKYSSEITKNTRLQ
jgi:hypothetical protein